MSSTGIGFGSSSISYGSSDWSFGSSSIDAALATTLSYDDFIALSSLAPIVLATIEPRQLVDSWSLISGLTYSYYASAPKIIRSDVVLGGVFADVVGVRHDTLALTHGTDLAVGDPQVELTQGYWRYDANTDAVNVRVTTSAGADMNANLADTIMLVRRLHFGTTGYVVDGVYYEPRIPAGSEIVIKDELEDLLFGGSLTTASGNMSLINSDGFFDTISNTWYWIDSDVVFTFGGALVDTSEWVPFASLKSGDIGFGVDLVELPLISVNKYTSQVIPHNEFALSDFPNMLDSDLGKVIPIFLGHLSDIKPTLVDTTDQKGQYMLTDPIYGSMHSIIAISVDGVSLSGGEYDVSLTGCTFTILNSAGVTPTTSSTVLVEAKGYATNAFTSGITLSYETSSDYYKYYGEQSMFIYNKILDVPIASIGSADALSVDALRPFEQALYSNSKSSAAEVIRGLEVGVLGRTGPCSCSGEIRPNVFVYTGTTDTSSYRKLQEYDIIEAFPDPIRTRVFSDVHVSYGSSPSDSSYSSVTVSDDSTKYRYLSGRSETREITTKLVSGSDALETAELVLYLSKRPAIRMEVELTSLGLFDVEIGEKVLFNTTRGSHEDGEWVDKVFEVQGFEKQICPTPLVRLVLNDATSSPLVYSSNRGYWSAYTHTWATAPQSEKDTSGYWCDDAGWIDPGDASTKNKSVWS